MSPRFEVDENESPFGELQRDAAWRRERVAVAAYYLAERRQFTGGGEMADWSLAEAQTDAADEAGS